MDFERIKIIALAIVLVVLSGVGDSQGFLHSAKVWEGGKFIAVEALKSGAGFLAGAILYWFSIRYLKLLGLVTPEIQTILWFVVTLVGVALVSGKFIKWSPLDQAIAVLVIAGVGWLLVRTGG
jgi:hypothetical protein